MEISTDHVAGRNFEAQGPAISITDNARVTCDPEFSHKLKFNSYFNKFTLLNMGITLPETINMQSGISLGLDPPSTESNPTLIDWSLLDSLESTLLEPKTGMDLGDDSAHDFLRDQDVGSVTLCDSPWPPVFHRVPYKRMPNFGNSETGISQPLLSVVDTNMDHEEVEASCVDSPLTLAPVSAPNSPQGATLHSKVPPTSASSPESNPVELPASHRGGAGHTAWRASRSRRRP